MKKENVHQNPITVIVPVFPEKIDELRAVLKEVKADLVKNNHIELERIGTIHYARWVIIDDLHQEGNPERQGPKLVFSSNFDGPAEQQMLDLATSAAELMDRIYQYCPDYPLVSDRTTESRFKFFRERYIKASSFYRGAPGRTLKQIRNESNLRNFMRNMIDQEDWSQKSALQIHRQLRDKISSDPHFNWAKEPTDLPSVNWPGMILTGIVIVILSPLVILLILTIQFFYERKDPYFTMKRSDLDDVKIRKLESYEDLENQNQFTQLVVMKSGFLRLFTFRLLMMFSKVLIKYLFVEGKLMGIPTIHFARWVLFDNNKRVLFFSNFDGSWQQYLGDFIDKSGWGLTGIFSNTTNFPKTRFLFFGGAYDEEHFLAWSRNTELQTQVWYNAYPNLSIKNVNNNSYLRSMLFKDLTESQAKEFLKRL